MDSVPFQIETKKAFSESLIWQLNRDFYQETGIEAWSENIVPHHMTSNSKVGKTYAELIFALLKDRAFQGHINEPVYLLELGAGHGRLAFHILQHLENLLDGYSEILPPYCYILSDIVEDNLSFFLQHSQLDIYFQKGNLDVAFFDAAASEKIELRFSKKTILPKDLLQPILAIGNYFFDSIPTDLFYIENHELSACLLSIHSTQDPQGITKNELIKSLEFTYHKEPVGATIYEDNSWNEIMTEYKNTLQNTFLFFPSKALICLRNIQAFSQTGLVLLTMDKGFHELQDLDNKPKPDVITHGSMSLWVNYHAISEVCLKQKGTTFFPSQSNFHLEIGCLLFLEGNSTFEHTEAAYEHVVNTFGPDDFNSLKQLAYGNLSRMNLMEMLALIRLSNYDSTFFIKLFPSIRQVAKSITMQERKRLEQTMDHVWDMYLYIQEPFDLGYEIGGILYDLGFYKKAIVYFERSEKIRGYKADILYNLALCYYQLQQDSVFYEVLTKMKSIFPGHQYIQQLESLSMD